MKKSILNFHHDDLRHGKFAHDWYNSLLLTQALASAKLLKSLLGDIKQLTSKQDLLSIFVLVKEYEKQSHIQNSVFVHVDENSANIKINILPQIIDSLTSYIQKTEFKNAKLEIDQLQLVINLDFAYENITEVENMGYGIDILHDENSLGRDIQDEAPRGEMEIINSATLANSAEEGQDTEANSDTDTETLSIEASEGKDEQGQNQDGETIAINNMSQATIMATMTSEGRSEIDRYNIDESFSEAKQQKQEQHQEQHNKANLANIFSGELCSSWVVTAPVNTPSQLPTITEEYFTKNSQLPEESAVIESKLTGESSSSCGIGEKDSDSSHSSYSCNLQ